MCPGLFLQGDFAIASSGIRVGLLIILRLSIFRNMFFFFSSHPDQAEEEILFTLNISFCT